MEKLLIAFIILIVILNARMQKKRNLLLCLCVAFIGLTLECHSSVIPTKEKEKPSAISTEGKTFQVLLDKAVFLKRPHADYTTFKDSEINVVKVTNLQATGEGSLEWAIAQQGPKIIVFEVGGVIDLNGRTLNIVEPFTYIAGQTAPAPGITLIKGQIKTNTHDVVLEHIASRAGDRGLARKSGWEADCFSTMGGYNVLIDHCSMTWGTDENLSTSGERHKGPENTSHCVTISNNIIAEGLRNSTHPKGEHSMGTLVHDNCRNIAVIGNLYAHNFERNPVLKPNAIAYIANNLIYDVRLAIHNYWNTSEYEEYPCTMYPSKASIIGNVMIPGTNTPADKAMVQAASGGAPEGFKTFIVYNRDNRVLHGNNPIINNRVEEVRQKPIDTDRYTPISSSLVHDNVLKNAGARPKYRDDIDKRIVQSVRDLSGDFIDSQDEVGGYPTHAPTTRALQVPAAGIEAWLASMAEELN